MEVIQGRDFEQETRHLDTEARTLIAEMWARTGMCDDVIVEDEDGNRLVMNRQRYEARTRGGTTRTP